MEVAEIPAPLVEPGFLLVRVDHSCISVGTEMSGIRASGTPLWKYALQPEKVKQVVSIARSKGLARTRTLVENRVSSSKPSGYSVAGTVIEVGEGIHDLAPGDRVACAGAGYASHAEVVRVPRNLAVALPEGVDFPEASTVTLGAIALQGVRRLQPTLGESFVVVGLGILGQITVQLLRAAGARVIGTDLDPARVRTALELGMDLGLDPEGGPPAEQVKRLTRGVGADGVVVTAATADHGLIATAFRMCRKKGRVVLVGDVGLNIDRSDIYEKELDFLVSTSYGPGRYDRRYEEEGLDYPLAYVRWTETRNMEEYLRLLAEKRVRVAPLLTVRYPLADAPAAYASLAASGAPLAVLLEYPRVQEDAPPARRVQIAGPRPGREGTVRLALVGAGSFAKGTHLPNLAALSGLYTLAAVCSRTGPNATAAAARFGARYATTDFDEVLADPEVEAVLIATRHNLHGAMTLRALRAGKHVLVEKPLALTREELDEIRAFYEDSSGGKPVLLTGFNRRFSRFGRRARELVQGRAAPLVITYRMNAGHLPLDHWVHTADGGGRNLGEACHIYDLFTSLTGAEVSAVSAHAIGEGSGYYSRRDNFVATVSFSDGSVASLAYTALGSEAHPKEQMEVFSDGRVILLDDYRELRVVGAKAAGVTSKTVDKGQREELEAFAHAIIHGGDWPSPLWEQLQAMEIALAVEARLGAGS